jgi:chromosome segregation ATPase
LSEQYRQTSNDLTRAKLTLADMETQINELQHDLQVRMDDTQRVNERIGYLENELQKVRAEQRRRSLLTCRRCRSLQHISLGQEYEIQLANLNRSLQRDEEAIQKLQADKLSYSSELVNIRDLNSTLETKKDQAVRQLSSKEIDNEQLESTVADMRIEINMLRTQINNEKAMVANLEGIISSLQKKESRSEIDIQECKSDLRLARERVEQGDLKMFVSTRTMSADGDSSICSSLTCSRQTQSKEIAKLRTQVINLDTDNQRLKSLLSSERYER